MSFDVSFNQESVWFFKSGYVGWDRNVSFISVTSDNLFWLFDFPFAFDHGQELMHEYLFKNSEPCCSIFHWEEKNNILCEGPIETIWNRGFARNTGLLWGLDGDDGEGGALPHVSSSFVVLTRWEISIVCRWFSLRRSEHEKYVNASIIFHPER